MKACRDRAIANDANLRDQLAIMNKGTRVLTARNRKRLAKKKGNPIPTKLPSGPLAFADIPDDALFFSPIPHRGPVYLYLAKEEYAKVWVEGGEIPIFPARTYLSHERSGVMTPDEIQQRATSLVDQRAADAFFGGEKPSGGTNFYFYNCLAADQTGSYTLHGSIAQRVEDAYVLCFSTVKSRLIMERLGKTICVVISDPDALRLELDRALGEVSHFGKVGYTFDDNRGHFVKSMADSWQAEYRFVWVRAGSDMVKVKISAGHAQVAELL